VAPTPRFRFDDSDNLPDDDGIHGHLTGTTVDDADRMLSSAKAFSVGARGGVTRHLVPKPFTRRRKSTP
jgi:hypothetical protein